MFTNINYYNLDKENKILIVFDDMIADMIHKKKLDSIVTELFITQSYFKVPKDVRVNTTHFFITKIPNRRELLEIARKHSSDINSKDFTNIYRKCLVEPYSFLVKMILRLHQIILYGLENYS